MSTIRVVALVTTLSLLFTVLNLGNHKVTLSEFVRYFVRYTVLYIFAVKRKI